MVMMKVSPSPDPRWENFVGGVDASGVVSSMRFEDLSAIADDWTGLVSEVESDAGPGSILATARSLFVHSWFDYDFQPVAVLVSLRAVEAALRSAYTSLNRRTPLAHVEERAHRDGLIGDEDHERLNAGIKLRNRFSHADRRISISPGMSVPMLEAAHRIVAQVAAHEEPPSDLHIPSPD